MPAPCAGRGYRLLRPAPRRGVGRWRASRTVAAPSWSPMATLFAKTTTPQQRLQLRSGCVDLLDAAKGTRRYPHAIRRRPLQRCRPNNTPSRTTLYKSARVMASWGLTLCQLPALPRCSRSYQLLVRAALECRNGSMKTRTLLGDLVAIEFAWWSKVMAAPAALAQRYARVM